MVSHVTKMSKVPQIPTWEVHVGIIFYIIDHHPLPPPPSPLKKKFIYLSRETGLNQLAEPVSSYNQRAASLSTGTPEMCVLFSFFWFIFSRFQDVRLKLSRGLRPVSLLSLNTTIRILKLKGTSYGVLDLFG